MLDIPAIDAAVAPDGVAHIISQFINQFCREPMIPVYNMANLLRSSKIKGVQKVIGLSCWGKTNMEELFNEAWKRIEPGTPEYEMFYSNWPRTCSGVQKTLDNMGILHVHVQNHHFNLGFRSIQEFLDFFDGEHPACEYLMRDVRRQNRLPQLRKKMEEALKKKKSCAS